MKKLLLILPLSLVAIAGNVSSAQDSALMVCVSSMTSTIGVSADLAYAECQKKTIIDCIKDLRGKSVVLTASKKLDNGYLFDLGNDKKIWQEGRFWSSRNCKVIKNGPRITKTLPDKNGFLQRYRWFRQGICEAESIQGWEYNDQLAFQACDAGGYIIDSRRNETDRSNIDDLIRGE